MTDNSLKGYLKRRTTKELDALLAYCLREENYIHYEHVILEILSILRQRDARDAAIEEDK